MFTPAYDGKLSLLLPILVTNDVSCLDTSPHTSYKAQANMTVNGTDCTVNPLTERQVAHLALARIVTGGTAFVACCITLLLIVFFRAFKARLQRFFLYFLVFIAINMLVVVLSVVDNYYINQSDQLSCGIVGYLNQYTLHVVLILGVGTVYVFLKPQANSDNLEGQTCTRFQEIVFVGLSIVIPAIYNLIPFIHDAYGPSKAMAWCGIKVEKDDCSTLVAGVCYLVILAGIPIFIVAVLSVGVVINIVRKYRHVPPQARVTLLLAIGYLASFLCYGVLVVVFIVYEVLHVTSTVSAFPVPVRFGLHMTHTLLQPLLIIILQVVVYIYYFRKYRHEFRTTIRAWKDCCRTSSSKRSSIIERTGRSTLHKTSIPKEDSSVTRIHFVPEFSDEYSRTREHIHGTGETEPLMECSSVLETGYDSMNEISHD